MTDNITYLNKLSRETNHLPELSDASECARWFEPWVHTREINPNFFVDAFYTIFIGADTDYYNLRRYRAELWMSDCDYLCIGVRAPSKKTALKYLIDKYCLIALHCDKGGSYV
tara:strand:+ start:783 stop:1121 length:339 start_codon:yes stop_codon:yes gene_type:complete